MFSVEKPDPCVTDLTSEAEACKLDPLIGREAELARTIEILSCRTKNNPILLGEPGVGKTAIVEGLAQRIVRGDVPADLQVRVLCLDVGGLVAGTHYRGTFEEKLKNIIKKYKGKAILFIDEIHTIVGAGMVEGSPLDAANILKPMLARGELRCIGATTAAEYAKHIEKDAAFERRFQKVDVKEPTIPETVSILRGLKAKYENHHGVRVLDAALVAAVEQSARYMTTRFLPDKAISLLDEACAATRLAADNPPQDLADMEKKMLQLDIESSSLASEESEESSSRLSDISSMVSDLKSKIDPMRTNYESVQKQLRKTRELRQSMERAKKELESAAKTRDMRKAAELKYGVIANLDKELKETEPFTPQVTPEAMSRVVSRLTGIPLTKLSLTDKERLLGLADILHKRVVGQHEAVTAVSDVIMRSRAGISRKGQPTGSFLFLGPTGVGKTELAKALAAELFQDEKAMIRLDMSEYMESHSVSKLIGSPPGYVGHDDGGQLTSAVRRRPYSVLLFDEVEKAHVRVWDMFLQVLDDGRLTDSKGHTVDFSNTIIIMTSNVGGDLKEKDAILQRLKGTFRPEFLNRLSEIIIFSSLAGDQMSKILKIQLDLLNESLQDHKILVSVTDAASGHIMRQAYNPEYGARPLRRWIDKHITTELSKMILSGQLKKSQRVKVGAADSKLTFDIE